MRGWRLEIVLLLFLLALGALWQVQRHPLHRPRAEPEQPAVDPSSPATGSPYLLLVDPVQVERSASLPLQQRDWSYAWINWLEQELGPYRIASPHQLGTTAEPVDGVRLAIVSRSAWNGLGPGARLALDAVIASGGAVIAESPPPGVPLPGPAERVVLLEEAFSTLLVKLQQGWLDGGQPRPRTPGGMIRTQQLCRSGPGELLAPVADQLERELLARVEALVPLLRWWPFPEGAAGVVAFTYDEAGFGASSTWMARHDWSRGVASTLFLTPHGPGRRGRQLATNVGSDAGIGWTRGLDDLAPSIRWGAGPFTLFWRKAGLGEQLHLLRALLSDEEILGISRSVGSLWDPGFGKSFRILSRAGIAADSSYGPTDDERVGYLFGTGLPFHPLDDNGRPFALLEVPYLFRNTGRYQRELQKQLVTGSRNGDHQLLVGLFDVGFMASSPSVERMEAWLELPQLATEHEHRSMSLEAYLGHWRARLASPIASSWDEATTTLAARVTASVSGLTLAFPSLARGQALASAQLDGAVLPQERLIRRGMLLLLPVLTGEHQLQLVYGKPGQDQEQAPRPR
ncbi:MAG: hypothetical protein FJ125_00130 [Deltaproteobacteria bacterium]|nr:hypothetical protein [Deltaproteobacteria bacterium]